MAIYIYIHTRIYCMLYMSLHVAVFVPFTDLCAAQTGKRHRHTFWIILVTFQPFQMQTALLQNSWPRRLRVVQRVPCTQDRHFTLFHGFVLLPTVCASWCHGVPIDFLLNGNGSTSHSAKIGIHMNPLATILSPSWERIRSDQRAAWRHQISGILMHSVRVFCHCSAT